MATPRLVFLPLCWRIATPQRFTGPWKPLPVVIAAMSVYWPSLKTSSAVTVLPRSVFAYSSCWGIVAPPISISFMSGFFLARLVCLGCVAMTRRILVVLSRFLSMSCIIASVAKFSGRTSLRSSMAGGFFIQTSVKCLRPYGVFVYVRIPTMRIGGVSITVAGRTTSLPKFGLRFRSSIAKTYVIPAL